MKIFSFILLFLINLLYAGDPNSYFSVTGKDQVINSLSEKILITKTYNLIKPQKVLVISNGTFAPYNKNGIAKVYIKIDGDSSIGNLSIINWKDSEIPMPHSFDCIATTNLTAGRHTISLVATVDKTTPDSNFKILKNTGLSILLDPAPYVISNNDSSKSTVIDTQPQRFKGFYPVAMNEILTNSFDVGSKSTNVVTLASGSSSLYNGEGDALWGILLNNEDCLNNDSSQWSVNDLYKGAELTAPMFLHSFHNLIGQNNLKLKGGKLTFDYFDNTVSYKVDNSVQLITLYGMKLSGKASISDATCNREDWGFFGTSKNQQNITPINTNHEVLHTDLNIPQDHNGVVLFLTKMRIQPGKEDLGGTAELWINVDGKDVGTIGVQEFKYPNCESSRTISASYLSTGKNRLTPGNHTVRDYLKATGDFKQIAHSQDLPLIYFD